MGAAGSCSGVWLPARLLECPPAVGAADLRSYTLWSVEGGSYAETAAEAFRLEIVEGYGDGDKPSDVRLGGIRVMAVPAHVEGIEVGLGAGGRGGGGRGGGGGGPGAAAAAAMRGQAHAKAQMYGPAVASGAAARGALFDSRCAPLDSGSGSADTGLVGCVFDCTHDPRMIVAASSEDEAGGNLVANVRGFVVPGTGAGAGAGGSAGESGVGGREWGVWKREEGAGGRSEQNSH